MNQLGRSLSRAASTATFVVTALGGALALSSCEDSTNTITVQLNLDRPVDVAFTCYGGLRVTKPGAAGAGTAADEVITSPQPLASCDARSLDRGADVTEVPPKGQEDLTGSGGVAIPAVSYFGLILQSGPGTVALAQFPVLPRTSFNGNEVSVLDADPLTPGKTSISVGATPVAIATDPSGCYGITANAGSCDLSTLDISSALKFDGQASVERIAVTNKAGAVISARPAAMVASPGITYPQALAPASDAERVGQTCPAKPQGVVYVAYPSCHVVAVINAATGQIEKGIQFAADGSATVVDGAAVTCADECGGQIVTTSGPEPVTLDLMNDVVRTAETASPGAMDARPTSRRLAIGSRNSNRVTVVELDANYLPLAAAPAQVQLEQVSADNDLGVLDVALTPAIGMGQLNNISADIPRNAIQETNNVFQFAYAVTTDGTLRVASILGTPRECDTRIDSRNLTAADYDMATLSCLPLNAAKRRQGSVGPGIPEPVRGVFSAVSTFRVQATVADERTPGPARLVGYFAMATSTTGNTYVIDIDDDDKQDFPTAADATPLVVDLSTSLPHQIRDQVSKRNALAEATNSDGVTSHLCLSGGSGVDEAGNSSGGARLTGAFNRLNQTTVIAKTKELTLPGVRQVLCNGSDTSNADVAIPELSASADPAVRKAVFPDTQSLRPSEDWRLVWEGVLSGDTLGQDIDGLSVRRGPVSVVNATSMTVSDKSRPYCAAGVEPFDTLQLRGCDPASTINQCAVGTRCFLHPDAATGQGMCLPENSVNQLAELCRDFLVSARRYNIGGASEVLAGQLTFHPRMRVLRSTPLEGCDSSAQCKSLADYEAQQLLEGNPKDVAATVSSRTYECKQDPFRKDAAKNQCVMTCQRDADCDAASACVEGTCMEGTVPDAQCLAGLQRYDLRVSDAFVVIGTTQSLDGFHYGGSSGYQHSVVAEGPNGQCVNKQAQSPLKVGRIPLNPPPCDDANPAINPCTKTISHAESQSTFDGTCTATSTELKLRDTPAIFFRNAGMAFHFVNPTYPGDSVCIGDRLGIPNVPATKHVPSVFTGFAFTFRQAGGYFPQFIRTTAVVPVRVLRGPQQSIWIVDEGDYLTENAAVPSTRGKVFRVESSSLTVINTMQ